MDSSMIPNAATRQSRLLSASDDRPAQLPQNTLNKKKARKMAGQGQKPQSGGGGQENKQVGARIQASKKVRGMEKDSPAVRLSKTLSWLLRHGAQSDGLAIRADGYVNVTDLVCFLLAFLCC